MCKQGTSRWLICYATLVRHKADVSSYHVRGAINQPKGVQHPHIPLLIGGGGEKVTLKLVARYGDACNVGGDQDHFHTCPLPGACNNVLG